MAGLFLCTSSLIRIDKCSMDIIITIIVVLLWVSLIELANHVIYWPKPDGDDNGGVCVPQPRPITVNFIKEDFLMQKYIYTLNMPAPGAKDVVERKMYLTINGVEEMLDVDPLMEFYKLELEENAVCSVYVIDTDDAGNASPPSDTLEWTVIDTIPPSKPDTIVIGDVEEVFEDEPVDDDSSDEPVDDDSSDEPVDDDSSDEPVDDGSTDTADKPKDGEIS